jgi:predicted alpha/beta-fold hydrolase
VPASIRRAVVFSVPLCLNTSSETLSQRGNYMYERRFLNNLRKKIEAKSALMPDKLSLDLYKQVKRIKDFDDFYTAPLHGFKDGATYYQQCSSKEFLAHIAIPTLIVNAKNDPFLSPECYPVAQVRELENVFLEIPEQGGHCGFASYKLNGMTWAEQRALRFLKEKY